MNSQGCGLTIVLCAYSSDVACTSGVICVRFVSRARLQFCSTSVGHSFRFRCVFLSVIRRVPAANWSDWFLRLLRRNSMPNPSFPSTRLWCGLQCIHFCRGPFSRTPEGTFPALLLEVEGAPAGWTRHLCVTFRVLI